MAFSENWDQVPSYKKRQFEKFLPKIWEAGEEDEEDEEDDFLLDEEDGDDAEKLADRVVSKLSELLSTEQDEPDEEGSEIAQALDKLSGHATAAQSETLDAVESMKAELAELRHAHSRQRLFSWVVIGLLVVLLFVGR